MKRIQLDKGTEYSWIKYIKHRIKQNKNFICIMTGATGSGKSWGALSIAEMLDKKFSIEQVVFKGTDLMKLINSGKLKRGSVIVWDEAGIDLSNRNWQSTTNKMLNFLIQTFRHKNFILLFTTPYSSFVDKATRKLFHAEIGTISIDYDNRTTKTKPQLIQYNGRLDKFYYKYLRVIGKFGVSPINCWDIPAPSEELIQQYEDKKTRFTMDLNTEIHAELRIIENKKAVRKPLTELQEKIVDCWTKGIYKQVEIARKIGTLPQYISGNTKHMRNKGYFLEDYQK